MNYVPKINRRAFVVGSAAAGGLALGFGLPTTALAAGDRAQFGENLTANELGIWVAVKPDDTVAIRVVRAEMGQGSQTGLAQLDRRGARLRLVEGHDRISDAVGQREAQARLGQLQLQRQPRDPRIAPVRARGWRCGAPDAHPGRGRRVEGAGRRMHDRQGRHHATRRPARRPPTARWRQPPPSCRCRRSRSSRTRRTGRSPASR